MQIDLRHDPAFTVARLNLTPGEPVRVEGGAMIAHSDGVILTAKSEGGIMAGIKRKMLAGESFFVTTYTAPKQGGWVDIAGSLPGDIVPIDVTGDSPCYVAKGNWIANSNGVNVDTDWGGMKSLFGGEGGFGMRATGDGQVVVSVYGSIDVIDLEAGEVVTIDTGHVVAYDLSINFRMRKAATGVLNSMKSGEGFVFDFTGPGRVLMQTRNPDALGSWIRSLMPPSR
ncbi:MAG: TIGR00266 family protein [Nakamurella sp.]